MTMKLEDLIDSFSGMTTEAQIEKIRTIRHARTIERPVAARKRKEREEKISVNATKKLKRTVKKMTAEERAMLIAALKGSS